MTRRRISQVRHFIPLVEVGLPFPSLLLSSSLTPAQPPKPRKNKQVSSVQRRRLKQSQGKSVLIGLLSPTQTHPRNKQTRSDYPQYVLFISLPLFCSLPSPTSHTHARTRTHTHTHAHSPPLPVEWIWDSRKSKRWNQDMQRESGTYDTTIHLTLSCYYLTNNTTAQMREGWLFYQCSCHI